MATPPPLQALLFDMDGTLADTEDAHCAAFNQAFAEADLDWYWDEARYTRLLEVAGGQERMLHDWRQRQPDLGGTSLEAAQSLLRDVHARKTAAYARLVEQGAVVLRPGVLELLLSARLEGLRLAIVTTTTASNVGAVLQRALGPQWRHTFAVVEDASTATRKKPHPQAYLQALERLGLPAAACIAFEDSATGLAAAVQAGLRTVVTPTRFTRHHDFSGAWRVLQSLQDCTPEQLRTATKNTLSETSPCPSPSDSR